MKDFPQYDDVGSFPLPEYIDKEMFNKFYWIAYNGLIREENIFENRGIHNYFHHPVIQSFQQKLNAGVEIINFPQHMDMYTQFLKPISDYETQPDLIESSKAIIPEMHVIEKYAKEYYERTNTSLKVKLCVTGPVELYVKKHGFTVYLDVALNFAKSVNFFLKNSLYQTKYLETPVISIDEPSFGYVDLVNVSNEDIITIFDKSLENLDVSSQIHLHTLNRADICMKAKNIDVLTCEYASDPNNIIPKRELDDHDKYIRVGIARTNIDNIIAESLDSGKNYEELKTFEGTMGLIDSKERIRKNLITALDHYGDRLRYTGPDCGLSGWSPPEVAYELLHRTYEVIKTVKDETI
ncbi:MAG: hypothetical protein GF353_08750 [Candidatus Lokiarchaeota archaeon]|nr:hypothetical protein [Candidatus Lokiarchaeota archaeon]